MSSAGRGVAPIQSRAAVAITAANDRPRIKSEHDADRLSSESAAALAESDSAGNQQNERSSKITALMTLGDGTIALALSIPARKGEQWGQAILAGITPPPKTAHRKRRPVRHCDRTELD